MLIRFPVMNGKVGVLANAVRIAKHWLALACCYSFISSSGQTYDLVIQQTKFAGRFCKTQDKTTKRPNEQSLLFTQVCEVLTSNKKVRDKICSNPTSPTESSWMTRPWAFFVLQQNLSCIIPMSCNHSLPIFFTSDRPTTLKTV